MAIEGYIRKIRRKKGGNEIIVFIPIPRIPYTSIEDEKYRLEKEKYDRDFVNVFSLSLEDVTIQPHRELK